MIGDFTTSTRASPRTIVEDAKHSCLQIILRIVVETSKGRMEHSISRHARTVEHAASTTRRRLPNAIIHTCKWQILASIQT